MGIRHLVKSFGKALISGYVRACQLITMGLAQFLLASVAYEIVSQQDNRHYDSLLREQSICKLEELLYRLVIVPFVAFLPASLTYRIALLRGDWRYQHDTFMRKQIMLNLEKVLPNQLSPTERANVARDFLRRRSCQAMDVMRLAGKGRALARLVEIRGLEHIEAALAAGKGAILCSAHFGLFSGGFSLIGAYGFPVTVVGNWRSKSDHSMSPLQRILWQLSHENRVARHRRRQNIPTQEGGTEAAIQIVEILRSNEVIAMPIDIPVSAADRTRAVSVDFLSRQILLLPGSVQIAQLTGSPIMVMVIQRSVDWQHQVLEISPIPLDGDSEAAFKRCVSMVEAPIYQNLAHWDGWSNVEDLIDLGLLMAEKAQI